MKAIIEFIGILLESLTKLQRDPEIRLERWEIKKERYKFNEWRKLAQKIDRWNRRNPGNRYPREHIIDEFLKKCEEIGE